MRKRWRLNPFDAGRIAQLEQAAGIPSIVAQLLLSRGVYEPAAAKLFLEAKLTGLRDPELLPGVTDAAERIHAAVAARRKIAIYGDYDADGMTGTSILLSCLKLLGADCKYYVPNRLEEGYGLNHEALRNLASQGVQLVVSVDCGIASVDEAETAKQLGIELIITDHHEFAEHLPAAAAIVHPRLPGSSYPFGGLCGAGVALKLAWALCQRASQAKKVTEPLRNFLMTAVGLAAIGTVADMVPLIDENRILVRHGLNSLKYQPPTGLQALMQVCKLHEKAQLGGEDIAFTLAPRLNAAGRFGQAQLAVELLTTDNPGRAQQLAEYIHELNNSRESIERSIQLAANKQAKEEFDPENDGALVLAGKGWHAGVIGLVAGKLAEKYHVPVVMISLDPTGAKPGIGSARSPNGVNLHEALTACSEHLIGHGGHAAAAGLKIDEKNVSAFRDAFLEYATAESNGGHRGKELRIDAEAPFCQLTLQVVRQIESLAPFGIGNPRPTLCATGVTLSQPPKRMGGGDKHISLNLSHARTPMRCVGFGFGDDHDELAALKAPLDIAFQPQINDFRGISKVEIKLIDWRVSEMASAPEPVPAYSGDTMRETLSPLRNPAMTILSRFFASCALFAFVTAAFAADPELSVQKSDTGVAVKIGDKPFATYVFKSGTKPIVWPIIGPTGQEMTRAWPMKDGVEGEKKDHIHHRSFWFTHGNINGVDFWGEQAKVQGTIEHKELYAASGGQLATIATRNEWLGPDGKVIIQDEPTLKFGATENARWIDFTTKVTAIADEVTFGDTKEGAFGVRVAETMKEEAKKGGKIITSEGLTDKDAWGKPAKWVDYHGPVAGQTVGIAIFDHPSSFRHPTTWHVRTYGLFAPNPFGLHDFPGGADKDGSHKMKKGDTFTLKYRVYFHLGDEKEGKVAEAYAKFAGA